jgi:hypothetical protein
MGDPAAITCRQAQRLMALAPSTPLPRSLALRLATHRDACPECGLSTVDVQSLEPVVPERSRADGRLRRGSRLALRFAVACALIVALSPVFDGWRSDPTLAVVHASGPVFVGGEHLDVQSSEQRAWRSDLIETGPGGMVELRLRGLELRLHAEAELLVESVLGKRMRHRFGRLDIQGRGSIDTAFGRLALESGAATLESDELGTKLTLQQGRAHFTNASGEHALEAGEVLFAAASGALERRPAASAAPVAGAASERAHEWR